MRRDESTHQLAAGVVAGSVAAAAYLVAMAIDIALTRYRSNDLRLLSGMVPGGGRAWPVVGTAMHMLNGAILGAVYGRLQHLLPGPGWVRGTIFALIENGILWPVITVLDRVHPDIQSGRMPEFNRAVPFLQEIFRHIVYGVVLGWTYEQLRK